MSTKQFELQADIASALIQQTKAVLYLIGAVKAKANGKLKISLFFNRLRSAVPPLAGDMFGQVK